MLAGIFVLVIAAGAIVAGVGYVRTAARMRMFRPVRGTIVTRETVAVPGLGAREGRWGSGGNYTPKFTYTYELDGETYTSDKYTYATRGFKKSIAEQMAADMPENADVFDNPDDKSEAFLRPNSPTIGWLFIGLGVFLGLIGFVLVAA